MQKTPFYPSSSDDINKYSHVATVMQGMIPISYIGNGSWERFKFNMNYNVCLVTTDDDLRAFKVKYIDLLDNNDVIEIGYEFTDNNGQLKTGNCIPTKAISLLDSSYCYKIQDFELRLTNDPTISTYCPFIDMNSFTTIFNERIISGDTILISTQDHDILFEFDRKTDLELTGTQRMISWIGIEDGARKVQTTFNYKNNKIRTNQIRLISQASNAMKSCILESALVK